MPIFEEKLDHIGLDRSASCSCVLIDLSLSCFSVFLSFFSFILFFPAKSIPSSFPFSYLPFLPHLKILKNILVVLVRMDGGERKVLKEVPRGPENFESSS